MKRGSVCSSPGERLLFGLSVMKNRAESETVRLAAGTSTQVVQTPIRIGPQEALPRTGNANPFAVALDVPIGAAGQAIDTDGGALTRPDGIATWSPVAPAGATASLHYRL